ncbi:hypothetical protein B5S30_g2571 [[Candida] boidinii]|nr:hypothetical protein B5S30_g2571 [[Candida] boidinii]
MAQLQQIQTELESLVNDVYDNDPIEISSQYHKDKITEAYTDYLENLGDTESLGQIIISEVGSNSNKVPLVCTLLEYFFEFSDDTGSNVICKELHSVDKQALLDGLIKGISLPSFDWIWGHPEDGIVSEEDTIEYNVADLRFQLSWTQNAYYKLRALKALLTKKCDSDSAENSIRIVHYLSSFTDEDAPWSNRKLKRVADELIQYILQKLDIKSDFLEDIREKDEINSRFCGESMNIELSVVVILIKNYLEPKILELSKLGGSLNTNKITRSGYSNMNKMESNYKTSNKLLGNNYSKSFSIYDDWKKSNIYLISLVNFIFAKLSKNKKMNSLNLIETYWFVLLPSILNFLDDSNGLIKAFSCKTLNNLINVIEQGINDDKKNSFITIEEYFKLKGEFGIDKGSKNIIVRTKVGEIFETSLLSSLLSMPKSFTVAKSSKILPIVYKTLINVYKINISNYDTLIEKLISVMNQYLIPSIIKVKDEIIILNQLLIILRDLFLPILGISVLLIMNKLVPLLLDNLIDPYVIFNEEGIMLILSCLEGMLLKTSERFKSNANTPGSYNYNYDILAGILLVWKRLKRNKTNFKNEVEIKYRIMDILSILKNNHATNESVDKFSSDLKMVLSKEDVFADLML